MSYSSVRFGHHVSLGLVAAIVGLAGCASSGADDTSTSSAVQVTASSLLAPEEFASFVSAHPDVRLINVHIPYAGHIDGTDSFIPFDSIIVAGELPADKDASLAIYCRSGSMSAEAVSALVADGYTNVVDLSGGMNAWVESGKRLLDDPALGAG